MRRSKEEIEEIARQRKLKTEELGKRLGLEPKKPGRGANKVRSVFGLKKKNEAVQETTITIEPLSEGPLKGKSIRCLHCEEEAVFLVGFGQHDVGSGAFCEEHTPTPRISRKSLTVAPTM